MGATITKGYTFGATETQTNTNTHSLIEAATIASINVTNFNTNFTSPVVISTTEPTTPSIGMLWYDTTNGVLREYDGSKWQPKSRGYIYTNKSGSAVVAGDIVIQDTANARAVKKTTTAKSVGLNGVCLTGANDNADVIVITEGYCPAINVTGSTSIGDFLFSSTTAGKADPSSTLQTGAFARALTSSSTVVEGQIATVSLIANNSGSGGQFSNVNAISSTRSTTAATGSVNYAHGLGRLPKFIYVYIGWSSAGSAEGFSIGKCIVINASTFSQIAMYSKDIGSDEMHGTFTGIIAGYSTSASGANFTNDSQRGAISAVDATNVTISWTLTGSPTSTTMNMSILCAG